MAPNLYVTTYSTLPLAEFQQPLLVWLAAAIRNSVYELIANFSSNSGTGGTGPRPMKSSAVCSCSCGCCSRHNSSSKGGIGGAEIFRVRDDEPRWSACGDLKLHKPYTCSRHARELAFLALRSIHHLAASTCSRSRIALARVSFRARIGNAALAVPLSLLL
jgi:hypothetical protein